MNINEAARILAEAARAAPSADNSQPWQFRWDENRFSCHYRTRQGLDPFGPAGHATLLSVGAVAENLRQWQGEQGELLIEDLDLGVPYFSVPLVNPPTNPCSRSHPLFARHTNRFSYQPQPAPTALVAELSAQTEGPARLVLLEQHAERQHFADLANTCCQARFCDRELHEWLMGSLRWSGALPEADDGLDVKTLDLPPGGRAFMRFIRPWQRIERLNRWLGLYRIMALAETQPLRRGPLIVCVVGKDTSRGSFSAGRLMERVWIELNRQGWAVHPYYVLADQYSRFKTGRLAEPWIESIGHVLSRLADLLETGHDECLHIAMRVGRPTRKPPISRRLEIEQLLNTPLR